MNSEDIEKIAEIVGEVLESHDSRIDQMRAKEEQRRYKDKWRWRHLRIIPEHPELPVPRLEINLRDEPYRRIWTYGLVRRTFMNEIEFVPMESSHQGMSAFSQGGLRNTVPHTMLVSSVNDMKTLNLPCFLVEEDSDAENLVKRFEKWDGNFGR